MKDSAIYIKVAEYQLEELYYLVFWKSYQENRNT